MTINLPIKIGASLTIDVLPIYREWLIKDQRDLEIQDLCNANVLDGDWQSLVCQARDILDGHTGHLSIHGPWNGLNLICPDRRVQDLVKTRLKQALEFAIALGATQMVLHSPFDFFGSPMVAHTPGQGLADEITQARTTLAEVLPLVQQANCTILIETCYDTNSAPLLALVQSFNSAHVRICLDTGHAFVMQRIGGPPPDQWVRDAHKWLGSVHLQDTDGLLDRHWAPGEGNINWYAFFEALSEMDHQPRLLLEIDHKKILPAIDWLADHGFGC